MAKVLDLAFRRIAQFDIHRHVGAIDTDVAGTARGEEILAGVRIDQLLEGALDLGFAE